MATQHTLRVRGNKWDAIEKKAWQLSLKANRVIKPTDVADALLAFNLELITIELIEKIKNER